MKQDESFTDDISRRQGSFNDEHLRQTDRQSTETHQHLVPQQQRQIEVRGREPITSSSGRVPQTTKRGRRASRITTLAAALVAIIAIGLLVVVIKSRLAPPITPISSVSATQTVPPTQTPLPPAKGAHASPAPKQALTRNEWIAILVVAGILGVSAIAGVIVGLRRAARRSDQAVREALPAQNRLISSPGNRLLLTTTAEQPRIAINSQAPPDSAMSSSIAGNNPLFDMNKISITWIALDLDGDLPQASFAFIMLIAHSLGAYAMGEAHHRVGLIASGDCPLIVMPKQDQLTRFQESLALVRNGRDSTLMAQIEQVRHHFTVGHQLIVVTAQPLYVWSAWADGLKTTGVKVQTIHVSDSEPQHIAPSQVEISQIIEHPSLIRGPQQR